jgi:autoinducer 2-degrading protein
MRRLSNILLIVTFSVFNVTAQNRGPATTDPAFYAVSYVEVMPSSKAAAVAALKQYRDASRKDEGYLSVELLEQMGRSAHFVVLEKWADQKTFDAHGMAAHTKQLMNKLEAIRLGSYDQRPYRTLTVGPGPGENDRAIVIVSHVDTAGPQVDALGLLRRLAEDSRKDEGNLRFDVLQGAMRANHFTIVETWRSEKALDAHSAAAHSRQFRDTIQPVLGSPLDERVFRIVD